MGRYSSLKQASKREREEFYYRKRGANIEIRCDWKHIWKGRCSPLHILLAYSPQSLIFFPPFYDHHPVFGQKTRIICLFTEFGPFSGLSFLDSCSFLAMLLNQGYQFNFNDFSPSFLWSSPCFCSENMHNLFVYWIWTLFRVMFTWFLFYIQNVAKLGQLI